MRHGYGRRCYVASGHDRLVDVAHDLELVLDLDALQRLGEAHIVQPLGKELAVLELFTLETSLSLDLPHALRVPLLLFGDVLTNIAVESVCLFSCESVSVDARDLNRG